jgi:hypothetical protein
MSSTRTYRAVGIREPLGVEGLKSLMNSGIEHDYITFICFNSVYYYNPRPGKKFSTNSGAYVCSNILFRDHGHR